MTDEIVEGERKGLVSFYNEYGALSGKTSTFWATADDVPLLKDVFPGNERTGTYDNLRDTAAWVISAGGVRWKDDYSDAWIKLSRQLSVYCR